MRLILTGILLALSGASGQMILDPSLTGSAEQEFRRQSGNKTLKCHVHPVKPALDFSFRFQTGYVVSIPAQQYSGREHRLVVLVRITPQNGGVAKYLVSIANLPSGLKPKMELEFGGGFLVGAGRYRVEWLLMDDDDRVCRQNWNVEARLGHTERQAEIAIADNTISAVSFPKWNPAAHPQESASRITVLMHAAPLHSRSTTLRAYDRIVLLGALASLLEHFSTRSVRLVVFNLDQQKELFRQDVLDKDSYRRVADTMRNLNIARVDYKVLQNRLGHIALLSKMIDDELLAPNPPDTVIFFGPTARYSEKVAEFALSTKAKAPHFYYLQMKPAGFRRAEFPDSIQLTVAKLKGKTITFASPGEFAKGIATIESKVGSN
jgi:hypothetical protein